MRHLLRILVISALIITLTINSKGQNKSRQLQYIDIEASMSKMEVIKLSQFADNIKYVTFENKDDMFINTFMDFDILGNQIIVSNSTDGFLLYDSDGHFICRIGSIGRGPGEYSGIDLVGIGANKHIYVRSLYDLLEYRLDGSFIKRYNKCFMINDQFYMSGGYLVSDSLILGHIANTTGDKEWKALMVSINGTQKYYYKNYIKFKPKREMASTIEGYTYINKFNKIQYYKELYNDTLFRVNTKFEMVPQYVFKLGKFSEPLSEREKLPPEKDMTKYIHLFNLFQTQNNIFLFCQFYHNFPAKRLSPKEGTNDWLNWHNSTICLGIYDRKTSKLVFSKPSNTDNLLVTSGLYNDIDAGPKFLPVKQVNDSTLVMWIEAKQLKDHIASTDFKNMKPKYPEKKKELEILANSLSDFDNPVLMFVTFKNR
jgi:hypothetical protein